MHELLNSNGNCDHLTIIAFVSPKQVQEELFDLPLSELFTTTLGTSTYSSAAAAAGTTNVITPTRAGRLLFALLARASNRDRTVRYQDNIAVQRWLLQRAFDAPCVAIDDALAPSLTRIDPSVFTDVVKSFVVSGDGRHAAMLGRVMRSNVVRSLYDAHMSSLLH